MVCTVTMPIAGRERDSRFSTTRLSEYSVSPWNSGAGCSISDTPSATTALPDMSGTLSP